MKLVVHGDGEVLAGGERQVALLCGGLVKRGHEVIVSCPAGEFADELERRGVHTTRIRLRGQFDLFTIQKFARWIHAERPDAVLLTSWKRMLVASGAAKLGRAPRVVQRLGSPKGRTTRSGQWRNRAALQRFVDALIVTSPAVAEYARTEFPWFEDVTVIPSAIEPIDNGTSTIRRELRIADAPLIIAVGTLTLNKNHALLLRALARMTNQNAHVAIAGWGIAADRLEALRGELGLTDRVHLLARRSDVPNLLRGADVYVQSSRLEGTPVALLEAMAAGLPVITTRVAGTELTIAETDGRGPAGWIVEQEDADALARTLDLVLTAKAGGDGDFAARVAEARWRAANWFGVDQMVSAYERALFQP